MNRRAQFISPAAALRKQNKAKTLSRSSRTSRFHIILIYLAFDVITVIIIIISTKTAYLRSSSLSCCSSARRRLHVVTNCLRYLPFRSQCYALLSSPYGRCHIRMLPVSPKTCPNGNSSLSCERLSIITFRSVLTHTHSRSYTHARSGSLNLCIS